MASISTQLKIGFHGQSIMALSIYVDERKRPSFRFSLELSSENINGYLHFCQ